MPEYQLDNLVIAKQLSPSGDSDVGATPIARAFFAGRYQEILDRAVARQRPLRAAEVPFVIGALTFVGRLDEANAYFVSRLDDAHRRDEDLGGRVLVAARFFLLLAHARLGQFDRARQLLGESLRQLRHCTDPWIRALLFQGFACYRYFTGDFRRAARHAQRALGSAHLAGFPYAQMLATDLRGHILIQLGQVHTGLDLLEQAKRHAHSLKFALNAHAIDVSIAIYQARFVANEEGLRRIQDLIAASPHHDSYSTAGLEREASILLALRGRCQEAAKLLADADAQAQRLDARRAKAASLIAHLHLARFDHGTAAVSRLLDEAEDLIDAGDVAFRAEVLGFRAYVAHARRRADELDGVLADLRILANERHLYRAKLLLDRYTASGRSPSVFSEDELAPLFNACHTRDRTMLPRALSLGLLGFVPEICGVEPGRRVFVFGSQGTLIVADHGTLRTVPRVASWVPYLLRLIARPGVRREDIAAGMWGIQRYDHDRHDPLIRTAIHRLRSLLAPWGGWVTVTSTGYGLAAPLELIDPLPEPSHGHQLAAEDFETVAPWPDERSWSASRSDDPSAAERVAEELARTGTARIPTLARSLGISPSTALRALTVLVAEGKVERLGAARATRYRVVPLGVAARQRKAKDRG